MVFILSVLDWKYPFLAKFGPKTQNRKFRLKFCRKSSLNMQNSMVIFIFYLFIHSFILLLTRNSVFGQICSKNLKLFVQSEIWYPDHNSNMQNSMVVFILSALDRKYPFWTHLFQKLKIVSLRWNLVLRLIWIWKIEWSYLFFFVFDRKYPFFEKFLQKIKTICWSWNLVCKWYKKFEHLNFWTFLEIYKILVSYVSLQNSL